MKEAAWQPQMSVSVTLSWRHQQDAEKQVKSKNMPEKYKAEKGGVFKN